MAPFAANMCKVDVYASSVLDSSLTECWQNARNFGQAIWWSSAGHGEFAAMKMGSRAVAEIGCQRMFSIGQARLFEELTALDDMEHIVRWVLVSHPSTISPFGQASFLNYTSSIQLRAVTMTNQTFAEWRGQFWTEPHYASEMEAMLTSWYFAGFKGLEACASGLETVESPPPNHTPYAPNVLNPDFSVPIQPPISEQTAFQSPLEVRHPDLPVSLAPPVAPQATPQVLSPASQGQYSRVSRSSHDRLGYSSTGMATSSSQAWQAARAAFSGAQPSLPSRNSMPKSNPNPMVQMRQVPPGPASNASSADSQRLSTGVREYDSSVPQNTHEGPPIGNSIPNAMGNNMYHSHLNSIQEGTQMASNADLVKQGAGGRNDYLDRSISNTSTSRFSKSSSLSSNQSTGSGREMFRNQPNHEDIHGVGPRQVQPIGQAVQPRASWQGDEVTQINSRPQTASARKDEAMQRLNVSNGQRPNERRNNMRRNIRPDWAAMKEVAYLDSEQDAELMAGVAQNMGTHHKEQTQRTSLEEEVAQLQERHKALHGERQSTSSAQYVSPFSANPFAAAQPNTQDSQ